MNSSKEFRQLAEVIKEKSSGSRIYYHPNAGNLGDSLIRVGTEKFFEEFKIDYVYTLPDEDIEKSNSEYKIRPYSQITSQEKSDSILLWGGGGAWCKKWKGAFNSVKKMSREFKHVIVLPSTYEIDTDIENVTFFARDKFESQQHSPKAIFCHDMAFFIGNIKINNKPKYGKGFCFRKDKESGFEKKWKIPLENVDISWQGDYLSSVQPMIDHLEQYREVHTDRLHVSIACCLLGVKVYLYPGSYFKNKAIFTSSIKDNYYAYWRKSIPLYDAVKNSIKRKINQQKKQ